MGLVKNEHQTASAVFGARQRRRGARGIKARAFRKSDTQAEQSAVTINGTRLGSASR